MPQPRTVNSGYEVVPIATIKPHPRNPRQGNLDAIKSSVDVNGFFGAVVANKRTGHILAGNHRYLAAKSLGHEDIPVVWVDVGEAEARRILLADNRTSDLGDYDSAVLASMLQGLHDDGGLLGTGYEEEDLVRLLDELGHGFDDDNNTDPMLDDLEFRIIIECKSEGDQAEIMASLDQLQLKYTASII